MMYEVSAIDTLKGGIAGLLKDFHHAVFTIRRRSEPLDEEALLRYFEHCCAYCQKPFQAECRAHLDRIIPVTELGDPWALHNVVCACSRCRRVRNGSRVDEFMRQVLGPALAAEADEVERRIRRIYEWIASYRSCTPIEIFGPDVTIYQAQLEALQQLERGFIQLLAGIESRLGSEPEMNANHRLDADKRCKQRIATARERLCVQHSTKSGDISVASGAIFRSTWKTTGF